MDLLKGVLGFFLIWFLSINIGLKVGGSEVGAAVIVTSISMLSGVIIIYASLILKEIKKLNDDSNKNE